MIDYTGQDIPRAELPVNVRILLGFQGFVNILESYDCRQTLPL
jgi:hypothetical protein